MRIARALLTLTFLMATACSDSPMAPQEPAGPSVLLPGYDGVWSGTTSTGRTVTFTVASNKVTSISLGYQGTFRSSEGFYRTGP